MTLQQFVEKYRGKYVDKYGRTTAFVQNSEPFGGQCASLVRWYLNSLGEGYNANSYGHGKNYVNIPNATRVTSPRNGDIVVWTGGQYGHVGIWYNGKVFNQNPHRASLHDISYFNNWGMGRAVYVRPRLKNNIVQTPSAKPTRGTYITNEVMNVRTGPGINYKNKLVRQLTVDGKKNATKKGQNDIAQYRRGTIFNVLEVLASKDGRTKWWARTPSGFICLVGEKDIKYARKR